MTDFCEYPELYNERKVKAAKQHKCCECNNPIRVGQEHMVCVWKFDGELNSARQHLECYTFARKLNLDIIGECAIPFGCVDEAMRSPDDFGMDPDAEALRFQSLVDEWSRVRRLHA